MCLLYLWTRSRHLLSYVAFWYLCDLWEVGVKIHVYVPYVGTY